MKLKVVFPLHIRIKNFIKRIYFRLFKIRNCVNCDTFDYRCVYCKKHNNFSNNKLGNSHGGRYNKTFQTPEECIDYNNSLLSKSFPELAKYYYHHPDNPRNWPWTFGNSVLGFIGFNDDDNICDEDFNENMEE